MAKRPRLTFEERQQLEALVLNTTLSESAIAKKIGRSRNCIYKELYANGTRESYSADKAQARADGTLNLRIGNLQGQRYKGREEEAITIIIGMYNQDASLTKIRQVTGIGIGKINGIILNYLSTLHIRKFLELEKRIAALEGTKPTTVEEGLSKDELYKKYLTK